MRGIEFLAWREARCHIARHECRHDQSARSRPFRRARRRLVGPAWFVGDAAQVEPRAARVRPRPDRRALARSAEHTSELPSLMRISYAVFCLKQKQTCQITHKI